MKLSVSSVRSLAFAVAMMTGLSWTGAFAQTHSAPIKVAATASATKDATKDVAKDVLKDAPRDADPASMAAVRAAVEAWLDGKAKVDEVRPTPIPSVFEVRVGTELIYVDGKGQYAFIEGSLIDLKGKRNLTRERTDELMAINFKDLPLDLAIKQVNGDGKRVLAVFEDPNCGYCRNLRSDLTKLDNATIYTFAIPILAADSEIKARKALCAPDRVKAWSELMLTGKVPNNPGTCSTSQMEKLIALGSKLNVSVTPTMFFTNGKRVRGYVPPRELELLLTAASAKG